MIEQTKLQGIYEQRGKRHKLYTLSLNPGVSVYDEKRVKQNKNEFREFDPQRSKLAAAIEKGCSQIGVRDSSVVLYLGASTGTTVSHVSDIVGNGGFVFAVEFAPRVTRELVFLSEKRKNIAPILANANHPKEYFSRVCQADIVYQDIAQKNQIEIFKKNCDMFLKKDGFALIAVKARSVDVTKKPKQIFKQAKQDIEKFLTIVDYRELAPLEKDHCFFVCKKK